jgi:hypothetical protein
MREQRAHRLKRWVAIVTLIASVASFSINANAQRRFHTSAGKARLTELRSVDRLKKTFERDTGKVRLVVLVSPT